MRIKKKIKSEDNSLAPSKTMPLTYAPLPAGFYTAIIRSVKEESYRAGAGEHKNPDSADGKWDYLKIRPTLHIVHDEAIHGISRHDLTIGVINSDGELIRPDGNHKENPVWSGRSGARYFLKELGFFIPELDAEGEETGEYELIYDPDVINDMVLRVGIGYEVYSKNHREHNMNFDEFKQWLSERGITHTAPLDVIYDAINDFNDDNGFTEDEDKLTLKSSPIGWYAMTAEQAEAEGFYHEPETHRTYTNEQAAQIANALLESAGDASDIAF